MRGRIDQHARYRELIAARLDRPLTRVELRTLTGHLKKCAACQQVDSEYRAERNMVRGLVPPTPPRDLWARTSSSLDREVARAYRAERWRRRINHGRRSGQPSTALMTAVAAIGVSAAIMVLQLAPAIGPAASVVARATPLTISPLQLAFFGQGPSDMAVYRTDVNQVCPISGPLDCVPGGKFVRSPVVLPPDMRAGNLAMNPKGNQLAIVGHKVGEDVIAVVMMPSSSGDGGQPSGDSAHPVKGSGSGSQPDATFSSAGQGAGTTTAPDANSNPDQTPDPNAQPSTDPGLNPGQPDTPPASAAPGLTVLSILANVQSAGSAPDWSANGGMLAFSAMPDDGSTGPDVYVWSPGDAKARAITDDHQSYFASWSGNRIVVSGIATGGSRPHDFVIDPSTGEQRPVGGPQMWLPTINAQRTQAVGWYGQLDTSGALPALRSGALYLMDWTAVDPFGAGAQTPATTPAPTDQPPATDAPASPAPTATPGTGAQASGAPDATAQPDATDAAANDASSPAPQTTPDTSTPEPQVDNTNSSTDNANNVAATPSSLVPLEPDRDPRAAPVVDWQARWSVDGEVLGVWIADSAGSTWGRLAVFAVDPTTQLVTTDNLLLPMTLARRGFSLDANRVAWVGPADDNIDGDLRIRTWGTDGVGGLRLKAPQQEEVVPAS
jgi:hypothetical protein